MAAASYPKTLSEMLEYDQSIGKTKLEEQFEVKFYALRLLFVALKSERLSTFPVKETFKTHIPMALASCLFFPLKFHFEMLKEFL